MIRAIFLRLGALALAGLFVLSFRQTDSTALLTPITLTVTPQTVAISIGGLHEAVGRRPH